MTDAIVNWRVMSCCNFQYLPPSFSAVTRYFPFSNFSIASGGIPYFASSAVAIFITCIALSLPPASAMH